MCAAPGGGEVGSFPLPEQRVGRSVSSRWKGISGSIVVSPASLQHLTRLERG